MKIVLFGASGNLGSALLKELIAQGHEVIACDKKESEVEELKGKYKFFTINAKRSNTLEGICKDADIVISTIGVTKATLGDNNYAIDYRGNHNLLTEACVNKVKKFILLSFITCEEKGTTNIPILNAKNSFEKDLLRCNDLKHIIYRPTAFSNDVVNDMNTEIAKGKISLIKGANNYKVNPIDVRDLAKYIVDHLDDENQIVEIGGKETYTYEEIANMCIAASGKPCKVVYTSSLLFDITTKLPKTQHEGMIEVRQFIKWALSHDMVGSVQVGEHSIKELLK